MAAQAADVLERFALDGKRVYVAGLSSGGALAAALALHAPGLVRAVAIHSGAPCGVAHDAADAHRVMAEGPKAEALPATRGRVPALIIHGKDDRTVAPVNAVYLARQFLVFNGFDPAALPPGATLPRPGMLPLPWRSPGGRLDGDYYVGRRLGARLVTIDGLGHAWSGGDAAQPFFSADGPDATRLVCDFFTTH